MSDNTNATPPDVTLLLQAWAAGDEDALGRLIPLVHREIAGVAHAALRREGPARPFQTTELVPALGRHHRDYTRRPPNTNKDFPIC